MHRTVTGPTSQCQEASGHTIGGTQEKCWLSHARCAQHPHPSQLLVPVCCDTGAPARVQWPSVCVCVCVCVRARACAKLLPLCLTPYNSMHCSSPGCSVHGILQARILEWFSMPSSTGSFQLRDRTQVSYIYLLWREGSLPRVPSGKP